MRWIQEACVWTMFTIGLALLSIRLWPLVLVGLLVYGIVSCKLWRKTWRK